MHVEVQQRRQKDLAAKAQRRQEKTRANRQKQFFLERAAGTTHWAGLIVKGTFDLILCVLTPLRRNPNVTGKNGAAAGALTH